MELSTIAAAVALIGTVLNWVVIVPAKQQFASDREASRLQYEKLQQALDNLSKSTDRLISLLDNTKGELNDLRERVAKLESAVSSAHKRIDKAEQRSGNNE